MALSAAGFVAFFIGVWLGVAALLALLGGWRALAETYAAPDDFEVDSVDCFRLQSVQLRHGFLPANYNGCVTLGLTNRGLYLRTMPFFRFFHPALLIPWQDIVSVESGRRFWWRWAAIEVRRADTRMLVYGSLGDRVLAEWRRRTGRPAA